MREIDVLDSIEKLKSMAGYRAPLANTHDEYFGRGKLLLSGEYFILEGARGLALPTRVGQRMSVHYSQSFSPQLHWKSFDIYGNLWFECKFEFWQFNFAEGTEETPEQILLQKLLRAVRKQNHHFLRDDVDVVVETYIDFPFEWGLGSSSTLIYNVAQWAYVSPFELHFKTTNGSGYDIACAQSEQPIIFSNDEEGPSYSTVNFDPKFKDQLYLVHLNKKAKSYDAIKKIESKRPFNESDIQKINELTDEVQKIECIKEFENWIVRHENIVSNMLGQERIKDKLFSDFWGEVKSLGAWGGDFVLVTTDKTFEETQEYFVNKGHNVVMPYSELCLAPKKQEVIQ
jgi:mevalonate kinase